MTSDPITDPILWDTDPDVCCSAFQTGACIHTEGDLDYYDRDFDLEPSGFTATAATKPLMDLGLTSGEIDALGVLLEDGRKIPAIKALRGFANRHVSLLEAKNMVDALQLEIGVPSVAASSDPVTYTVSLDGGVTWIETDMVPMVRRVAPEPF